MLCELSAMLSSVKVSLCRVQSTPAQSSMTFRQCHRSHRSHQCQCQCHGRSHSAQSLTQTHLLTQPSLSFTQVSPPSSVSLCPSVCLSVCLSVRLSVCPSVCLSVILWNEGGGLRLVQCELVTVIVGLTRVCCSVNGKVHRKIVTCLCMCGSVSMYRHCIYVCMLLTVVVRCCLLIFVRWSTQSQLVTLFTDGRSTAARHYTCM